MSAAFSTTRIGVRLLAVVLLAFAPALSLGAAAGDAKPRVSKPKQQARATYRLLKQWDDDCKDHNKNKDKCPEAPPPEAVSPPPAAETPPPAPPPPSPTPPPPPGTAPEQSPAPLSGDPTGTTEDLSEPSVEQTPPDAAGNDAALVQPVAPPPSNESWLEPAPTAPVEHGTAPSSQSAPSAAPVYSPLPQTFSAPVPAPVPERDAGDFESTNGWNGANSELTVIRDGLTGNAVRVRRTSRKDSFAVVAAKAIAGSNPRHRARAFVRSASPGMFVCLRIEELATRSRVPRMSERCRPATTGWQRVSVETSATAKGTRLVVSVRVLAALGGTSFDVDGFRLR